MQRVSYVTACDNMNEQEQGGQCGRKMRRLSSLYVDAEYEVLIKGIYESHRDI